MKYTQYFLTTRERIDRASVEIAWIEQTVSNPAHEEVQSDARIRRWSYIREVGKWLRVVLLEDKETIHNAFFDRSFKKQ